LDGNVDRPVMAGQGLSSFRIRGSKAAVRQLRDATRTRTLPVTGIGCSPPGGFASFAGFAGLKLA